MKSLVDIHHRPADGMVWVTTGLSGYADAAAAGAVQPLTDDAMDTIRPGYQRPQHIAGLAATVIHLVVL